MFLPRGKKENTPFSGLYKISPASSRASNLNLRSDLKRGNERAATKIIPASASQNLPRFLYQSRGSAAVLKSPARCEVF